MTAPPTGPFTKEEDPDVCIGEEKACGLCRNCTAPQGWHDPDAVARHKAQLAADKQARMRAPYGPFTLDIDPTVCIGAPKACGTCRNCAIPGWEVGEFDVVAVQKEIDRLRAKAKAPLTAAETAVALAEETAFVDAWDHTMCEPPRCPHDQHLAWYQTPHCGECRDPWPCNTATLVCARIWLESLTPIVPHQDERCPACGRMDAHTDRTGHPKDTFEGPVSPHQWPVVGYVPPEESPS